MEILLIAVAVVVAAVLLVLFFLHINRNKHTRENERYKEFLKRSETALWATARVVEARGGITGEMAEKTRLKLTLEVTPPGKATYRAHTNWLVPLTALGSYSSGSEIQVKIDTQNPKILYPGSSQAAYIPD